jgi:hypothetical protein
MDVYTFFGIIVLLVIVSLIMEYPYIFFAILIVFLLFALAGYQFELYSKKSRSNKIKEQQKKAEEHLERYKKILGKYYNTWSKRYSNIDPSDFKKLIDKIKKYNFDKKLTLLENEKEKYEKKLISAIKKEAKSFNSSITKLEKSIAKEYLVSPCSSCNEQDLILINFNSNASSAQLKCTTCSKKSWAKIKNQDKAEEYQEVFDEFIWDCKGGSFWKLEEELKNYFDNISWEGIKIWKKADDLIQYRYLLYKNFNVTGYRIWEIIHEIDGVKIYSSIHSSHIFNADEYEKEGDPYNLDDYVSSDNSSYYSNKKDDAFFEWREDFKGKHCYDEDPSFAAMINLFDNYFPDFKRLQFIEDWLDYDNYKFSYEKLNLVIKAKNIVKSSESNRQPIPQDIKTRVWQRDEGKCVNCGSNEKLEYDHIIPIVKGGANTFRNIQLLCEPCNRSKGAKI